MIKIITTVGTSIFTNYQKPEVRAVLGRNYISIDIPFIRTSTTRDGSEIPASAIEEDGNGENEYQAYIRVLKKYISTFWFKDPEESKKGNLIKNKKASAEISSILQIIERENVPCEVHLIATDTLQSVIAAELIVDWFEEYEKDIKVLFQRQNRIFNEQKDSDYVVKNLRVGSHKDYEDGFFNFFELLNRLDKPGVNLILNITGGYKALIPVATLYAQVKRIPIKYLHESEFKNEESLISLSYLPFHFDWGLLELLADYIEDKDLRDKLSESSKILEVLRKYKIIKDENKNLTIIGDLVGKYIKDRLWEGTTSFGFFAEYKVLEALIELGESPKRGVEYWWDQGNLENYYLEPQYNRDNSKEIRIEIDILSKHNNKEIWYEVKAFSKMGLKKAYKQAETKLEFQRQALKKSSDLFRLVLYKFDFEEIKRNQQLENIEKIFSKYGVPYEIWYFDIPANIDSERINNKSFFEQKIELKKLEF